MGPFVAQGLAALIANLVMLSVGMIFGWSSPSLPKLLQQTAIANNERELRISPNEGSWVVSLTSFGAIFGPILVNLVVDRIGRKWSLNIIVIPILISWLIIGLSTSAMMLYVGRFIGGLSVGASYALMPMYLGEIAEDRIRGALGTLMSTIPNIGMLVSFSIGPWISRQMLCIVSAIPPLIFLILSPWIPETPHFLLMKGDRKKANASLIWLRRRSDVSNELSSLQDNVIKEQQNKDSYGDRKKADPSVIWLRQRSDVSKELSSLHGNVIEEQKNRDGYGIAQLFGSSSNRRAFIISLGLLSFQQFSGVIVILSYASLIFESSGMTGWSSLSVIIMGIVKLLAGISVVFLIDIAGRRPILMLSTVFTSIFLFCEAVFFHVKYLGYDTSSFSWIPLVGIVGYYLSCIPGLISVPYTMIGELFPTNVKAPATMLLSMYGAAMGVIIAKIYQSAGEAIGTHWMFYFFATTTFAGLFFIYFCVPETKRMSLEHIQEYLRSGRSANSNVALLRHKDQTDASKG